MPVYQLIDECIFPPAEHADAEGLLAVGGDLSTDRLLLAYHSGIFPWYAEGQPILWWSPDPRMVLFPKDFKRRKSLRQRINSGFFDVRFDHNFEAVIDNCARMKRAGQEDTWIVDEMKLAYIELHRQGYAHSVETYVQGKLVGGLYGVSIGGTFFGESMFHNERDASKVALWHLVDLLTQWSFHMIDVQQDTEHLRSMGARAISRNKFLTLLAESNKAQTKRGPWSSTMHEPYE